MKFVIQYTPTRNNFLQTITPEEAGVIERHFAYLKDLLTQKKLRLAARRTDGAFGIAILELSSLDEAKSVLASDPVIHEKVFTGTVGEFRIALVDEGASWT